MADDWIEELAGLVFESSFMTLATVDADGTPRVTPVEYACDGELRFYWVSPFDARHSQNLSVDPRVAWAIHDRLYVPLDGQPRGLYGEGLVEGLDETERPSPDHVPRSGRMRPTFRCSHPSCRCE